jgi:hypothetical protein
MRIKLAEVEERGLHVMKGGRVEDESGNEYHDDGEMCWLDEDEHKQLLIDYIEYVEKFPDYHEAGDYPVCFEEWFRNDRLVLVESD